MMERDPRVLVMGEDVGGLGGVFRVTDGLQADFGPQRVLDTPLAESGIVGTAIGLAIRGYRPVCEIQFDGFIYPAFDQIVSQLAKIARAIGRPDPPPRRDPRPVRRRHRRRRAPQRVQRGVIRAHAGPPRRLAARTRRRLRTIQQAIASDDPVLFYEPKARYWDKGDVDLETTRCDTAGMHRARVLRPRHRLHRWSRTARA